jgi:hypothetical protein
LGVLIVRVAGFWMDLGDYFEFSNLYKLLMKEKSVPNRPHPANVRGLGGLEMGRRCFESETGPKRGEKSAVKWVNKARVPLREKYYFLVNVWLGYG